jgi:hypothetical protein
MKAARLRTQGSTRRRPKAEAPTLADGIWQSQSITTARLEYAIEIAYGKEVGSNEKGSSKSVPVDCGVVASKVNLRRASA